MNEDRQEEGESQVEDRRGQWVVVVMDVATVLSLVFGLGIFLITLISDGESVLLFGLLSATGAIVSSAIFGWLRWMFVFVRQIANR